MTNIKNRPIYIDELDTKSRTDRKWDLFRFIWIYLDLFWFNCFTGGFTDTFDFGDQR